MVACQIKNITAAERAQSCILSLVFSGAIRKQLAAFLEGFYEIIPKRLISIFTEQELELLISGLPTIDIDDLKANTEYHKYQSSSIQVNKCTLLFKYLPTAACVGELMY